MREIEQGFFLDELETHLAPIPLDGGTRLFDNLGTLKLETPAVKDTPAVTQLRYKFLEENK